MVAAAFEAGAVALVAEVATAETGAIVVVVVEVVREEGLAAEVVEEEEVVEAEGEVGVRTHTRTVPAPLGRLRRISGPPCLRTPGSSWRLGWG